jgi:hypothetical protein
MEHAQVQQITTCETSAEIWKRLETIYEQRNEVSVHLLISQFYQLKIDQSKPLAIGLSEIKSLAARINSVRPKMINEDQITAKIIDALPNAYRTVVTAWDSVEKGNQTLELLKTRLLKEEVRIKKYETGTAQEDAFL